MAEAYKIKFESLASEYGKLVSQLKVVKKAYLESKANSEQLAELVKSKDKTLRKNEIEIESLNFRNQQLTKRISVLQNDLTADKKASKKGDGSKADNSVVQEELEKRIVENSKLACQLEDSANELCQLREKLENDEKAHLEKEKRFKCDVTRLKHLNQKLSAQSGADETSLEDPEKTQMQKSYKKYKQENQRLKMEYNILKMEVESLRLANKKRERCESSDEEVEKAVWESGAGVLSSSIGKMDSPFQMDNEVHQREELIVKYFRKELGRLITEKAHCESLIELYAAECEALALRCNWIDIDCEERTM